MGPNKTADLIFIPTGWKNVSDTVKLLGGMMIMVMIPKMRRGQREEWDWEKETEKEG